LSKSLEKALTGAFVPGSVCMFDAIESIRDILIPPATNGDESRPAPEDSDAPSAVDIEVLQAKKACTACLDEFIIPDLAELSCKHYLCAVCMNCEIAAPFHHQRHHDPTNSWLRYIV
jgi:hypothetical protein